MTQALRRTPLYSAHLNHHARMVPFAGWEMPVQYEAGQLAEHNAVRTTCGLFDVSHMGQVRIRGAKALAFLQRLVPGDISRLADGKAKYTQLCNEQGGVLDDLIISRLAEDEYFAVVNAATREKDFDWIIQQAKALGFHELEIADESEHWAMIAIQGPQALSILEQCVPYGQWAGTRPFTTHTFAHEGRDHLLSRTGYTGEDGAELLCPVDQAESWWREFLAAGAAPCGLAARDTLRLEAGLCLYGNDLSEETTPVEARLSWSVGWKKEEDFIGRRALEKQKADGPARRLMGLRTASRRPIRQGDKVHNGEAVVGEVTSGGFSPVLQAGIAMAYIDTGALEKNQLEIESRGRCQKAEVVKPPFVKTGLSKK